MYLFICFVLYFKVFFCFFYSFPFVVFSVMLYFVLLFFFFVEGGGYRGTYYFWKNPLEVFPLFTLSRGHTSGNVTPPPLTHTHYHFIPPSRINITPSMWLFAKRRYLSMTYQFIHVIERFMYQNLFSIVGISKYFLTNNICLYIRLFPLCI